MLLLVVLFFAVSAVNPEGVQGPATELLVRFGQDADGRPTAEWLRAIAIFHDDQSLREISQTSRPLSDEEALWANLIEQRLPIWPEKIEHLLIPFRGISAPGEVTILLGNIGGSDAFIAENKNIALDLNRMQTVYGSANKIDNVDRVDRFFAHELTHLLHKEWRRKFQPTVATPLEQALWGCLTEGLGNYRSLSARWTDDQGNLSAHAKDVLSRLQPILVERLALLEKASPEEAEPLMEGLSMAPFEEKWGALPVALWLSQEARDSDYALRQWVEAGPRGIIDLAAKYLPGDLAAKLPKGTD